MQETFTIIVCFLVTLLSLTSGNQTETVSDIPDNSHSLDKVTSEYSIEQVQNQSSPKESTEFENFSQTLNRTELNNNVYNTVSASSVKCNTTKECEDKFHRNSSCLNNECLCQVGSSLIYCSSNDNILRFKENVIFKAAMIAVACFTAAVVTAFVLFFLNRRKICRFLQPPSEPESSNGSRRGSDVFSVSDRLARQRLADKPPTYQDVLRRDRLHQGTPPPAYTSQEEEVAPYSSSRTTGTSRRTRVALSSLRTPEHLIIARLAAELQRRGQMQQTNTDRTTETSSRRIDLAERSYVNQAFVPDS